MNNLKCELNDNNVNIEFNCVNIIVDHVYRGKDTCKNQSELINLDNLITIRCSVHGFSHPNDDAIDKNIKIFYLKSL